MNKAYKFRIYPNKEQQILINKTFGCCRKVWNLMLSDKIENYKQTKSFGKQTPAQYKSEFTYLKEIDSLALANVQLNLEGAFRNCFDKKRKTNTEFPKFKSKHKSKKSYTTNFVNGNIELLDNEIKIPKLGNVKAKFHRLPSEDYKLKSITISKVADKYYASILFEYEEEIPVKTVNKVLGLDYSSKSLYVDSNNHSCDMPHYFRESQSKLRRAQRKLSRRIGSKKDEIKSHNYLKQLDKVNRIHAKIANQRNDFLHKESKKLAIEYDVIVVEDLNMKNISRCLKLGKSTMDNGFGMFRTMLKYKLEHNGGQLIKISKWFPSSQTCSCCRTRHKEMKDLSIRTLKCDCGLEIDRDYNAAINIKNEGLRLLNLH